ncbi:MBL fold metallo-hydrolase [Novosphingobium sp. AP12]|uniref:MBL fold metallo-hydrolase n=1 Tax=Novosphingobium sp. AP12 TaxID=1144305 RepID=UPI000271F6C6|nr:MBL fold metallo-hydrolase [Novosphingobium sp. AP12]EJL21274.1 Zn-dependent hydrolase, glyoxylase [Novosphingobium sp. AP12]
MQLTWKAALFASLSGFFAASPGIFMFPKLSEAAAQQAVELQAAPLTIAGYHGFALRDGAFEMPNDGRAFVLGVPTNVTADVLRAHRLASNKFAFSLQPLLVRTEKRVLLFDTGAGRNFGTGAGHILSSLARARMRPEDITDVFISHGHGDHIGGLITPEGRLAFPNATVHISRAEWQWLRSMTNEKAKSDYFIGQHDELITAVTPKIATFDPDATLIPGLVKAVDIRGHSPGHSAYMIGSGRQSVLFVGDTMHHSITSVVHPEWLIAFDGDKPIAKESRIARERLWAQSGQRLYVGHFPYPGFGTIIRSGKGFVWHPLR